MTKEFSLLANSVQASKTKSLCKRSNSGSQVGRLFLDPASVKLSMAFSDSLPGVTFLGAVL